MRVSHSNLLRLADRSSKGGCRPIWMRLVRMVWLYMGFCIPWIPQYYSAPVAGWGEVVCELSLILQSCVPWHTLVATTVSLIRCCSGHRQSISGATHRIEQGRYSTVRAAGSDAHF
jgi:hypothetical protein